MEVVKKTDKYLFVKKKNNRFGVKTLKGQWINGEEKAKLLAEAGFIKLPPKKAEEPAATETAEAAAEPAEKTEEGTTAPAE